MEKKRFTLFQKNEELPDLPELQLQASRPISPQPYFIDPKHLLTSMP
jgi:hypothetical protein